MPLAPPLVKDLCIQSRASMADALGFLVWQNLSDSEPT